ncbi:MAG: radical SAM protein [Deltaproteobacteria bacterium]|nr:radical SAM protein [Deltaproteobacteria bacterium]
MMSFDIFAKKDIHRSFLRLPRYGWFDLTYRCNNNCRHCWVRLPASSHEKGKELSSDEIYRVADEARQMGCNEWSISGGEPMLRPDFPEIFDYLTRKVVSYSLNTNGYFINPATARLLVRKGRKMVALYGADAKVHDMITRRPGSFAGFLRGCAYLKEAGAGFTVQIVPMRDNYHQLNAMFELAASLSPSYRIGASFLYLSAQRNPNRNREIIRQRLTAREVVDMDPAIPRPEDLKDCSVGADHVPDDQKKTNWFFRSCIMERQEFHIDPYGTMSFCSSIKEPSCRFDLRRMSFQNIWDKQLPTLADQIRRNDEYDKNCGACEYAKTCSWCPAYAYLETGRLSAPIKYLCEIAKERELYNRNWLKNNRRYFNIAGLCIQVDSDLPFAEHTFDKRFDSFRAGADNKETFYIHHHFNLPDLSLLKNAQRVHKKKPWEIYRQGSSWIYVVSGPKNNRSQVGGVAVFNNDHTRANVYHRDEQLFHQGNWGSLTSLSSDQIMLSHGLADRQGFFLHSSGLILNGHGILFVGPSRAGKSTMAKLLRDYGELLCDDRIIVRRRPEGFFIHGTWGHGELPQVANKQAPLKAIIFLKKAKINRLIPIVDKKLVFHEIIFRVVKPLVTPDWWGKTIDLLSSFSNEVPAYRFLFTKSPGVLRPLESLVGKLRSSDQSVPRADKMEGGL